MSDTGKMRDKKAPRAASKAPSSGSNKEGSLVPGQGTSSQVSSGLLEVPDFQLEAPSAAGSRVSASVFSHPTAAKSYDKVYFWGLSRTVLTHTLTGRPIDNGPKSTWTKAVQSYYDLTQPKYTLSAETEEKFSESRDRFRLRSASDKKRAGVFEDINIGAGAQETLVDQCILGLAPAILLVVELAQALSTAAEWIGNSAIPEAAWRSLWDFLAAVVPIQLRMLQKGVGDVEVIDMLEQSVRLPQADRYIRSLLEPQGYDGKMYNELTNETSKAAADTMRNKKKGSPEAHRLKTVHQQAQMAAKYHKAAFAQWQNTLRLSTDHADAPLRSKADGLWALALNDFFDGDALLYSQANPHFLPLDVTSRLSRYQASHAPPFVKSLIHRSTTFMNSPKNEGVATRLHYVTDTMISGVLGTDSSSQLASERRAEGHTTSSGHDGLRAETERRKRLPYVPLPSVLLVPFFVREYKRLLDHPRDSGVIQCRLALAATVKFLGTLSVTRRPVYGLITEGPVGSVHMAVGVKGENAYSLTNVHLRDEEDIAENGQELAVHVFGRGCNMFNLKSEQGAIAYVAFLVNLYTTVAPALATELRTAKVRMHGEWKQGRQSRFSWSMEQNTEVMAYEKKRQEKRAEERKARGEPEPEVEMEDDTLPEDFTFFA
ncbi:hypothetical protein PENSPDRAFT_394485 [Peniophora sp. CONT]|nr:hypothetical protein PENSPDRAFT_394485 [Peniophora sp. CONT]